MPQLKMHFSNTEFQGPTLGGVNVVPTSEMLTGAIFGLLMVGEVKKKREWSIVV
jgi:hypothetical protein